MPVEPSRPPFIEYQRLLYRSQFVLGPSVVDVFASSSQLTIRPGLHLTVHADLNLYVAHCKEKTLILLGFILDPDDPQATDADIIDNLVQNFDNCSALYTLTARLGGRWILIADDGREVILFNDAAGLRQVFYSDRQTVRYLWCGSQPGIIADIIGLDPDTEADDFIHSPEISANREYWWPGVSSLYKEIIHLLPNHYLSLHTGKCHRYWPNENLHPLSIDVAVHQCSNLLRGLLASAANRFDLVLALTAGWDSRLLLAASQPIKEQLSYSTLKIEAANLSDNHPDITVPATLLSRLGLKHDIIESPKNIDEQFSKIFRQNVTLAHDIWCRDAQAIFYSYGLRKVVISGSVSEVAKNFYVLPRFVEAKMTAEKLASLAGMGGHPFVIRYFQEWLAKLGNTFNLRILDIFYWEQRVGNWLAMCQKEFDIAWQEIFSPLDCRLLLMTMLSVNNKYRQAPKFLLYETMILALWPEVLQDPVNPHKWQGPAQQIKLTVRNQLSNVKHLISVR